MVRLKGFAQGDPSPSRLCSSLPRHLRSRAGTGAARRRQDLDWPRQGNRGLPQTRGGRRHQGHIGSANRPGHASFRAAGVTHCLKNLRPGAAVGYFESYKLGDRRLRARQAAHPADTGAAYRREGARPTSAPRWTRGQRHRTRCAYPPRAENGRRRTSRRAHRVLDARADAREKVEKSMTTSSGTLTQPSETGWSTRTGNITTPCHLTPNSSTTTSKDLRINHPLQRTARCRTRRA